ncbi:MAG: hypothetical protein M3253_07935, partial [Chloroflexota bacterium]|nr:hypothetical protein [Chloroflexota bacterium]
MTAFVGRTLRGPIDRPIAIASFVDFERLYGGLWTESPMSYAVQQFFTNGGRDAVICRIHSAGAGSGGGDSSAGERISDGDVSAPGLRAVRGGLWMLEHAAIFNILCIPPLAPDRDVGKQTWDAAAAYAAERRAMLLVDPPGSWKEVADISPRAIA